MKKAAVKPDTPGAVDLIEEAVHLLRAAPATAWALYLAGAVPWVLGLGYFWATASRFAPRPEEILWHALGLVVLYLGLKVGQAEFCARLRAMRFGTEPGRLSWRGLGRTAARQARVQGWAVPLLPPAALLVLPLVATWTYFESATALAASPDAEGDSLEGRACREAVRWPWPAHLAVLLFSGVWLCVWINIATTFYAVPWLARTLLGVENIFGLSGWSVLNSTLLALVTILTWLAVDPLVKSYHVLRTFYGEARHTGEDLRLELRRPAGWGGSAKAVRMMICAMALGWLAGAGPGGDRLQAAAEATRQVSTAQVDKALDEVLQGRDFRWDLEPLPVEEKTDRTDGWIKRFVRQGFRLVDQVVQDVRAAIKSIAEWVDGLFKSKKDKARQKPEEVKPATDFRAVVRGLLYVLLGMCLIALAWILRVSWRKRPVGRRILSPLTAEAPVPDLHDEKLEASRLPVNEWLELARTQLAAGEWRLALRALYLASLASLGERGLVSLARSKTNLDYERELARRAAGRTDVVTGFRMRRLSFEGVWYGRAAVDEERVRAWLAELESDQGGTP